jgi:hypothetical protein
MRRIQVQISPTGEVALETHGFEGSSCRDASRALERALGLITRDQPRADAPEAVEALEALRECNP